MFGACGTPGCDIPTGFSFGDRTAITHRNGEGSHVSAFSSDDPNAPKAYLNIILFDKNYIFVDAAYRQLSVTAEQVGTEVKAPHDYLVREVTVPEPGYAFIFFSNEDLARVDVHFDDVTLTHTHSTIVAGADYYPFGLAMDGREIDDEPYRWGYRGQFSEKDLTTGMQEFELRMYDPRIGKWLSPDPYGQFASPYLGMGNSPHISADPDGGLCCGPVEVVIDGVKYMQIPEILGATASRITATALSIITSIVTYNMAGGSIFKGADHGLYSMAPSMTGNRYYQAIDGQWQFIADEGLKHAQYAKDLSSTIDGIVIAETTIIEAALTGMAEAGLRSLVFRQGARATLNVSQRAAEGAQLVAQRGKELFNFTKTAAAHMGEAGRMIPIQTLDDIIKAPMAIAKDPQGTSALMHYSRMWKNGKLYNVEVLYDKITNTIMHFKYSRQTMGPLSAIPK